jgi:hypothetical protein
MDAPRGSQAAVKALVAVGLVALLAVAYLLLARLGLLRGAGASGTSTPIPRTGRPFAFQVEVLLEQITERNPDFETSGLKVVLRDAKGKEVETPDVRLELDGVALTYAVAGGNYYDRHPYYRLREDSGFRFEAGTAYELAARRGDDPVLPLARFTTPKPMGPENFRIPATHPRGGALEVFWKGLSQPVDLLVTRTLTFTDEHGNHGFREGGPYGDDVLRRRVGARGLPLPDGSTTIPASYFSVAGGEAVASIRLEFTAAGEARFLCRVLESSSVVAVRRVTLPVEIAEPRPR